MGSQAVKPKVECAVCGKPQHHAVHSPTEWDHDFVKPVAEKRGAQLRGRSQKREDYLADSDYAARSAEARTKQCVVRSPVCTGQAQGLHHILARSAAGGLEAAERIGPKPVAACNACNEHVEGKGREWARANGWRTTLKGGS